MTNGLKKYRFTTKAVVMNSLLAMSLFSCSAPGTGTVTQPTSAPTTTPSATATPTAAPTAAPTATPTAAPTATPIPSPTPATGPLTLYALVPGNVIMRFSSATPSNVTNIPVTGLGAQELLGMDFRPSDGKLYGVTTSNMVVTIDTNTGAATMVSAAAFNPVLGNIFIGFDFNPTADRIRIHSYTNQNLRLNPVNGTVAAVDTELRYADSDINAGATPMISGSAYTNSVAGAASTELYAIDDSRDILVKLADPNNGALSTVGPLGVNTSNFVGFDIAPDGRAFAALKPSNINNSVLYSVNLATGVTTLIENIGTASQVIGLAIAP